MKSNVIETKDRVFIDKIPRLKWNENTDNSFIRSVQLSLNALGENYTYSFLMGVSGAAFRLHFHPDWCPSSADSTTGFDVSKVLFSALGYKSELVSIDDNSFSDIKSLYQKIIAQINRGIPIIAINLKVCPEWGIITGYLKNKPGLLCRTYFDETDAYSLADRAPWLTFFIGKNGKPLNEDTLFKNVLKIAVQLAKTDEFENYKSGFSAYKKWIDELKSQTTPEKSGKFKEWEVNLTIFNYLVDSRRAALNYLSSMRDRMNRADIILDNYKKEVKILEDTQQEILPGFESGGESWTKEIISKQMNTLIQVLNIEKDTIGLFEKELKIKQGNPID